MNTLDLQAAAAFLHIHPVTLQEKARAGEIPGAKNKPRRSHGDRALPPRGFLEHLHLRRLVDPFPILETGHAWVSAVQSKNRRPIAVPLNATALEVSRRQLGKHPVRVFTYAKKPLGSANTRAWRDALKRAGIGNFRWHDLRHTWASWHRQAGTPTHELQRLGGWRSSVMVERYAHLAPDHLAKAANRLDALLGGYDLATLRKEKGSAEGANPL